MRTRLFAMGGIIFASALAACGGGGGGTPPTGGTTSTPTPTPTPTATPTPSLNPYGCVGSTPYARVANNPSIAHPIANGDTFAYTGSLNATFTQSAPCPQPTATSSATVGVTVVATPTTLPNGAGGTDLKATETDVFPTQTQSAVTEQSVTESSTQYLLYATKVTDANANTVQTTYGTPQLLDQLSGGVEVTGSWSNNPAGTLTESFADGTRATRTIASDGSYTDTETFPDGGVWTITVNGAVNGKAADGSGTYVGLHGNTTYSYAAPSGGNIVLTIDGSTTRTFPAWFSTPPAPFITDSFTDSGTSSIDPACRTGSGVPTSGNKIVETQTTLDPIVGYKETRAITSYNADGYGAVCVTIADTLSSYYDYNADTTAYSYQSHNGQPNSVNVVNETLGMTSPSSPYSSIRSNAAQGVSSLQLAQRLATLDLQREVQRSETLHAFVQRLLSRKGAAR